MTHHLGPLATTTHATLASAADILARETSAEDWTAESHRPLRIRNAICRASLGDPLTEMRCYEMIAIALVGYSLERGEVEYALSRGPIAEVVSLLRRLE